MSSTRAMSRRRFLAVIGSAGSVLGVAGLGGWRLLAGRDYSGSSAGWFAVDPGVEVVEVQPGFVDAAVWGEELLTLRTDPAGTRIVLRSEITGTDYPVDAPEGFAARCVGTIDGEFVIGGHQVMETGSITFEAGPEYNSLAKHAGSLAKALQSQPESPEAVPHTHAYVEFAPSMLVASRLGDWGFYGTQVSEVQGGSIGAIFSDSEMAAVDVYAIAEVPDSIEAAALISISDSRSRRSISAVAQVPIDHGAIWGTSHDGTSELLLVSDRDGTRIYDTDGAVRLSITDDSRLLGVSASGNDTSIAVASGDGQRELRHYHGSAEISRSRLEPRIPIVHRVSSAVTVAATEAKSPIASAARSAISDSKDQ